MPRRARVGRTTAGRALAVYSSLGRTETAKLLGVHAARLDRWVGGRGTISRAEASRLRRLEDSAGALGGVQRSIRSRVEAGEISERRGRQTLADVFKASGRIPKGKQKHRASGRDRARFMKELAEAGIRGREAQKHYLRTFAGIRRARWHKDPGVKASDVSRPRTRRRR